MTTDLMLRIMEYTMSLKMEEKNPTKEITTWNYLAC